jgi:signal transduction histidine kinase
VLLKRFAAQSRLEARAFRSAVAASAAIVVTLVCSLTWFVIVHHAALPTLMQDPIRRASSATLTADLGAVLAVCALAVVLLGVWRRSMLDLWLLVASFAWLLDSILLAVIQERYTVAWYANRFFAITAAAFVLFVLLAESTMLYARLALSVLAQRRERERRPMSMKAMSAAIEHEMRQPLAAIATNAAAAQRWLRRPSPEIGEARVALGSVHADVRRSIDVVQSVRALFGALEEIANPVDANELVRETIAMIRRDLDGAGIEVQLELASDLAQVHAHRGQLQQVLLNLVRNAADAMRGLAGPAVLRISSRPLGAEGVAVAVADSGVGIAAEHVGRIFDPFFTTKPQGMGMGLAVCRSIAEAHGGSLTASPGVPRGAVFDLALPGMVAPPRRL